MNNKLSLLLLVFGVISISLFSCAAPLSTNQKNDTPSSTAPIITVHTPTDPNAKSYQANVQVFRRDLYSTAPAKVVTRYRLTQRQEGDTLYVRADFDAEFSMGKRALSYMSDGKQMVVFDTATQTVRNRYNIAKDMPLVAAGQPLALPQTSMPGRINLPALREKIERLRLDFQEDAASSQMRLSYRNLQQVGLIRNTAVDTHIRTDICLNTANQTVAQIETEYHSVDGSTTIMTQNYIYEDRNGTPVTIGIVASNKVTFPASIVPPGQPTGLSIADPAKIPTMTKEEIKAKVDSHQWEGGEISPFIGDPYNATLETQSMTLMQDIEIDGDTAAAFRLLTNN